YRSAPPLPHRGRTPEPILPKRRVNPNSGTPNIRQNQHTLPITSIIRLATDTLSPLLYRDNLLNLHIRQ
ncbi:hypothetical protein C7212DRAFT_339214, partial [Tuber magnatum]